MINKIWSFFIIVGCIFYILSGNLEGLNSEILNSSKVAFDLIVQIFPVMALWMGLMKIATSSGLMKKLSTFLSPILSKIFPEIPKGHESLGFIASNVIANLFGLGNSATPFGIKAMHSLQEINKDKKVASNSMITFLVLNTSGLTIVPTTIISLRMFYGSSNPTEIVFACILASTCATVAGLLMDRFLRRGH